LSGGGGKPSGFDYLGKGFDAFEFIHIFCREGGSKGGREQGSKGAREERLDEVLAFI
jgi:hypothetical protein